jgi:ABC-type Mn2+/Zn2+ transport system permease subunit
MIETLLTPLHYDYMLKAIGVSAVIGGVCAFLSCFITLKGWSLMGDALVALGGARRGGGLLCGAGRLPRGRL